MYFFFHFRDEIEVFLTSDDNEKFVGKHCNAFQRKLIYQLLEQRYRDTISATTHTETNNQKVVKVCFHKSGTN